MSTAVDIFSAEKYTSRIPKIFKTIRFDVWLRNLHDRRGTAIIVLLCGGDKTAQAADIQAAKELAALWTEKEDERYCIQPL